MISLIALFIGFFLGLALSAYNVKRRLKIKAAEAVQIVATGSGGGGGGGPLEPR